MTNLLLASLFLLAQGESAAKMRKLTESGKAEDPCLLQAADGALWLAWYDRDDRGKAHLYIRRSENGRDWGKTAKITDNPEGDNWYPSLIQTADGSFAVAWFSGRDGNAEIYFATSKDGLSWNPAVRITDHKEWDWAPALVQMSDGTLRIVWASARDGAKDLWERTSKDGAAWTAPERLGVNGKDHDDYPSVHRASDGSLLLAWVRSKAVEGQKWDASYADPTTEIYFARSRDGRTWSEPRRVTRNDAVDLFPCVSEDGKEGPVVFWTSTQTQSTGAVVRLHLESRTKTSVAQVSDRSGSPYYPRAVRTSKGEWWIAWVTQGKAGKDIAVGSLSGSK